MTGARRTNVRWSPWSFDRRRLPVALGVLVGIALVLAVPAFGQNTPPRIVYIETQTVTNATALTVCTAASTPANCSTDVATNVAYIVVETNPIRWFANGTAPTTAVGNLCNAGCTITLLGHSNVTNFRMIATGSNATVTSNVGRP